MFLLFLEEDRSSLPLCGFFSFFSLFPSTVREMAQEAAQPAHPLLERFPMNATSHEPQEVARYFQNRAIQLLSSGSGPHKQLSLSFKLRY
jgi:hypothetical protein